MKRSLKSQPEPRCLADFRADHPNGTWEDFRATLCYNTLRAVTRTDQAGLCAYCERLLREHDQQIAHFHPKADTGGPVNWALHWPNLWFACCGGDQSWLQRSDEYLRPVVENRSCDVAKDDRIVDGLVLAPNEVPAFPRIFRYEQFVDRIDLACDTAKCAEAGIDPIKVATTINTFNLNCRRLSEARMTVHREIERELKRLRDSRADARTLFASLVMKHLAKSALGEWKPFFTMIRWRFGTTAEAYLQSINYQG